MPLLQTKKGLRDPASGQMLFFRSGQSTLKVLTLQIHTKSIYFKKLRVWAKIADQLELASKIETKAAALAPATTGAPCVVHVLVWGLNSRICRKLTKVEK